MGNEDHCRLFVEAARWVARRGAPWRQWPAAYGQWNSVYRCFAHWCGRGVWPHLMVYLQADPDLSAGLLDSTVVRAHMSAAGAPQNKGPRPQPGRLQHPDPHPGGSPRPAPAPARDGGPVPRQHPSPGLGGSWTDAPLPYLIADRAYDSDAFRAWLAQRGIEAVIPARKGHTNPSPTPRNGTKRATPWNGDSAGSVVAARGHPLRQIRPSFPGFSVPSRGLSWLKSYLNTT